MVNSVFRVIVHILLSSADFFFKIIFSPNFLFGNPSECETVLSQVRPNVKSESALGPNSSQTVSAEDMNLLGIGLNNANRSDSDKNLYSTAADLGLHCLQMTAKVPLQKPRWKSLKRDINNFVPETAPWAHKVPNNLYLLVFHRYAQVTHARIPSPVPLRNKSHEWPQKCQFP